MSKLDSCPLLPGAAPLNVSCPVPLPRLPVHCPLNL